MAADLRPRVGVSAIISDADGKLLVGKRKGSHGAGTWQFPGGHLEYQEDMLRCAERESEEETALKVKATRVVAVTNDVFESEGKHYITLFIHCEAADPEAEPQLMEPEKCEGWHWKTWEELEEINEAAGSDDDDEDSRERLFLPLVNLLKETSSLEDLLSRGSLSSDAS